MRNCINIAIRPILTENCFEYEVTGVTGGPFIQFTYIGCSQKEEILSQVAAGSTITVCVFGQIKPVVATGELGTITAELRGKCGDVVSDQGYEYLDLNDKTTLRESKVPITLDEESKFLFDYTLDFDLPKTDRNVKLLDAFINPNLLDNKLAKVPVRVEFEGGVVSDHVLEVQEFSTQFTASLTLDTEYWAQALGSITINDVDLGKATMDYTPMLDNIQNNFPYVDGNDPFWYGMVDFGGNYVITAVGETTFPADIGVYVTPLQHRRPLVYVLPFIKQLFCEIGWEFRSPLLESNYGRKQLMMLTGTNFGTGFEKNSLNTRGTVTADYIAVEQPSGFFGRFVRFDSIEYGQDNLDADNQVFEASGTVNITYKLKIRLDEEGHFPVIKLASVVSSEPIDGRSMYAHVHAEHRIGSESNDDLTYEITGEVQNISMCTDMVLGFHIDRSATPPSVFDKDIHILQGSEFEITGIRKYPERGEEYDINSYITDQFNGIEAVKAIAHVFNLHFSTDVDKRLVTAYAPYPVTIDGEFIEGYYLPNSVDQDLNKLVSKGSERTVKPETDLSRYTRLKFKDPNTNDSNLGEALGERLWSNVIDHGDQITNTEVEDNENVMFQPAFSNASALSNRRIPFMPRHLQQGVQHNFDTFPMILTGFGNVEQKITPSPNLAGILPKSWIGGLEYQDNTLIPTVAQVLTPTVEIGTNNTVGSNFTRPTTNNIFGITVPIASGTFNTNYDFFYRLYYNQRRLALQVDFLVLLSITHYRSLDLRSYYYLEYLGRTIRCTISKISDFNYCGRLTTPITFIPDVQSYELCGLEGTGIPDPSDDCNNAPTISFVYDGPPNCYLFTLGGLNNAVIDSVQWEVKLTGTNVWIPANGATLLTMIYCNEVDYFVRATVSYEDCPDVTAPPVYVEGCTDKNLEGVCNYVIQYGTGQEIDSYLVSPTVEALELVTSLVIVDMQYCITLINDPNTCGPLGQQPYTQPVLITPTETVRFFAQVSVNGCPPQSLEWFCTTPPQSPPVNDCSLIDFDLQIAPSGNTGCWLFEYTFTSPGPIDVDTFIKYRISADGVTFGPWLLWDGVTEVCAAFVEAKLYVHFCDDLCPLKCISANNSGACNDPFDAGTPSNLAYCSDE